MENDKEEKILKGEKGMKTFKTKFKVWENINNPVEIRAYTLTEAATIYVQQKYFLHDISGIKDITVFVLDDDRIYEVSVVVRKIIEISPTIQRSFKEEKYGK